jgi:dual specificity phosphatase 3
VSETADGAHPLEHANADRVAEGLWVGGDLDVDDDALGGRQLDELAEAGVTQIVDVRSEWNDADWVAARRPDLDYVWLGVDDAGQRMADDWFEAGTDAAIAHLGAGGTTLVHCHMGINRGPSMGFAVMLRLGWDPVEALARIFERRPVAYADYADDALDWWLRHEGVEDVQRAAAVDRLRSWRRQQRPDLDTVIRRARGD